MVDYEMWCHSRLFNSPVIPSLQVQQQPSSSQRKIRRHFYLFIYLFSYICDVIYFEKQDLFLSRSEQTLAGLQPTGNRPDFKG